MLAALLLVVCLPARAAGTLEERVGLDALRRDAGAYIGGYLDPDTVGGEDFARGAGEIVAGSGGELTRGLRGAVRAGVLMLGISLLWGMSDTIRTGQGETFDPVRLAGVSALTALTAVDVNSLLSLGRQALDGMNAFAKVLLPAVALAGAVNGLPASSAAREGATLLFLNLLLTLINQILLPLLYAYIVLAAAGAALYNDGLNRLAGLVKGICVVSLIALLTGFVFYLTLSGAVAGHADAVAQKAAKTALNAAIPVAGKILADAADTAIAGAGVVKGTAGVLGLLTVLAICLGPFAHIACRYLVYKATAALCATVSRSPAGALLDSFGSAFALMLGMVGGEAFMLYVALVTSVQGVSP